MNDEKTSFTYQLISYLLRYPDETMASQLDELKSEFSILDDAIKQEFEQFTDHIVSMPLDEWTNHYIDMFDFGRLTNLYITYLKLGEQRERGLELLKLKKYYEANGFDLTDEELPDYLPLMLEFCAQVSKEKSNELLNMHAESLEFIRQKLNENKSPYVYLFNALLSTVQACHLQSASQNQ